MRLIDAERVRAEIFKASMDEHFMPMKLLDCDTVTEIIDNAPTIEECKTGRWAHIGGDEWVCSKCGYVISTEGSWEHPKDTGKDFCEHCGAKMEGEK